MAGMLKWRAIIALHAEERLAILVMLLAVVAALQA
jgi:hypothetical protein